MNTQVTEIHIMPIKAVRHEKTGESLVALASCVLDGKFFVNSIGIFERDDGRYRLTYPTKKREKSELKLFYPIGQDIGKDIEEAIVGEYIDLHMNPADSEKEE